MEKLSILLETVSPMFSSSNGKDFNLSPQTVRGVMRFWYRAVVPRIIDIDSYGKENERFIGLKKAEELLFGSTEKKSLFDVMVDFKKNLRKIDQNKAPQFTSGNKYDIYAIYGIDKRNEYLDVGSLITLNFIIKTKDKDLARKAKLVIENLIQLISYVGGFGAKSRKGFGSFKIHNEPYPDLNSKLTELDSQIKNMLSVDKNFSFNPKKLSDDVIPDFPMLVENKFYYFKLSGTSKGGPKFKTFKEIYNYLYKMSRDKEESG